MKGINKVILIGTLGSDPESHHFNDGGMVTNISIATTEKWKDKKSGEMQESTEWHKIKFFGRLAEIAAEYLKKGSKVYVEGKLQTKKWQDQQGNDRYTTEINARDLQFLSSSLNSQGCSNSQPDKQPEAPRAQTQKIRNENSNAQQGTNETYSGKSFDDDLPF